MVGLVPSLRCTGRGSSGIDAPTHSGHSSKRRLRGTIKRSVVSAPFPAQHSHSESSVPNDFEIIGPYHVLGVIGQGGMGTVYKGVHAKSKEEVAIKVISGAIAQHARFRRRFDAEIQTLLRLKHPNIVQLIGFGEEKGLLFYSMEYVDGENLHQMLRREKRFPWERVLDWAIEIGGALKHAHDLGIIHRDLKPANLMVNREGRAKLTDFGIAKLFGALDQTVPGSVLGTADFMSPEQAEGKPVSLRSDLYALGAICYTLLAGRAPFTGNSVPEVLFNVRYGHFTSLRDVSPETPIEFCDLIEELMRRDPAERPPTTIVVNKRLQALKIGLSRLGSTVPSSESKSVVPQPLIDETSLEIREHPSIEQLGRDLQATRDAVSPAALNENNRIRSNEPFIAGPNDDTRMAAEVLGSEIPEIPSGIGLERNTNFTEVTDVDRKRSTWLITEEPSNNPWRQWLSIAGLVTMLLACLAAAYWFSRSPNPDTLYEPISKAIESNDPKRFESVEEQARRFVELYPDDARTSTVVSQIDDLRLDRTIRQWKLRSRSRSEQDLDAVEIAFLDCLKAEETDPQKAKRKLEAMLTVFPDTDELSSHQRTLVAAAKRMLAKIAANPIEVSRNAALESLQAQMRWAETHLLPEGRKAWLQSMIELYQEKPWAAEIVESAKRMVDIEP